MVKNETKKNLFYYFDGWLLMFIGISIIWPIEIALLILFNPRIGDIIGDIVLKKGQ